MLAVWCEACYRVLTAGRYKIGSFLRLLPWHSCAVAHQHSKLCVCHMTFLLLCTQRFCLPSNLEFAVFRRYVVEDDSDDADVVAEWERARGW